MKLDQTIFGAMLWVYRRYRRRKSEARAGFRLETTLDAYRTEKLLTYEIKKHYCERKTFAQTGVFPNLDHPKTYSEKIIWLALNYKNPLIARCADKYEMKSYVREKLGEDLCVPTIGVYSNVNDIPFDALPDRFVLKSTAGWSGKQVELIDRHKKVNLDRVKGEMAEWLYPWNSYYYNNLCITDENIRPRIMAEEMLGNGKRVNDYKIHCFNGKPRMMLVVSNRSGICTKTFVWIEDWTVLPIQRRHTRINTHVKKPKHFDKMIEIAEKLSEGFPLMRVDLYEENDRVYVGEMTFSPGLFLRLSPREWDVKLGQYLDLGEVNSETEN